MNFQSEAEFGDLVRELRHRLQTDSYPCPWCDKRRGSVVLVRNHVLVYHPHDLTTEECLILEGWFERVR